MRVGIHGEASLVVTEAYKSGLAAAAPPPGKRHPADLLSSEPQQRPTRVVKHATWVSAGEVVTSKNGTLYTVESLLGSGGMGIAYRARRNFDNALVALKLPGENDPDCINLLRREASILSQLNHPHIVHVYDHGETGDGYPYIAMELVKGPTLAELLESERSLSAERALKFGRQIAEAMHYAHQKGVVHCDLKPANIIISTAAGAEAACILDFGISEVARDNSNLEEKRETRGSLLYTAPEQIKQQASSFQSDVYQLALMLFECLTGRLPFEKSAAAAVMYRVSGPLIPDEFNPDLPANLRPVLEKAMARKPIDRHTSMKAFADCLSWNAATLKTAA